MYDKRPAKGTRALVVKCNWNIQCLTCWEMIDKVCEKENRDAPQLGDKEFFIPYYAFDYRCQHNGETKPYLFESVYGTRRSETTT